MSEINLCFIPHAGGSAMGYKTFKKFLHPEINTVALELAGRGSRLSEKCFTDAHECALDLFYLNKEIFEKGNYALFGHSLGTVISFELARIIKHKGLPGPSHIFFSGKTAPHSKPVSIMGAASGLSDEEFLKAFSSFGTVPDVILSNDELRKMFLPIIRADFTMAENYHYEYKGPELSCDISVFYGKNDMCYSGQDIDKWQECTTGKCYSEGFEGDHFYFNNPVIKQKLCDVINTTLIG